MAVDKKLPLRDFRVDTLAMTNEIKTAKTITLYTDDLVNAVRTQKINNFVTDCDDEFLNKFNGKDKGLLVMGMVMGQNTMLKYMKNVLFKGSRQFDRLVK